MANLTADRRCSVRMSEACTAVITNKNRRGCVIVRGRTTDVSESGVFVVGVGQGDCLDAKSVVLEMTVPAAGPRRTGRRPTRQVRYLARIVRIQKIGHMLGVGLTFVRKLN